MTHVIKKPDDWTSDDWATPPEEVEAFAREFGRPFDLDPCCRAHTAKAPTFYTLADDGLKKPWFGYVWLNMPFSNASPWLEKALVEITRDGGCDLVVAMFPPSTETAWFHDWVIEQATEIRFRRGRVKYIGWMGTPIPVPNAYSRAVFAIYRRGRLGEYANRLGGVL